MFTGKPLPSMPPLIADAGWAEGTVRWCAQSALGFGSDRRIPVRKRPIVTLRRDGGRAVVLPCTSQDKSENPSFRELVSPRDVMWFREEREESKHRTFAFWRCYTVSQAMLGEKFGVMNHAARINLLKWAKERY